MDCVLVAITYYLSLYVHDVQSWPLRWLLWNAVWFTQGAFMTGIWVIAHECGHQAFCKWGPINDFVGWVFHSALLVPYFSWKYTHAAHHSGTSDQKRDTVFLAPTHSQIKGNLYDTISHDAGAPLGLAVMLLLGWPLYLAMNAAGQKYPNWENHFNPYSTIFLKHQRVGVALSDLGIVLVLGALYYWAQATSWSFVGIHYFAPYLWVNFWLVCITFLQHTHPAVPHYRGEAWNFVRGALATVDRDYGFLNHVLHHITDTHVAHHMFSKMPHYNAMEATIALREKLGDLYLYDDTFLLKALVRDWNHCRFIADEGDVCFYQTDIANPKKNV